MFECGIPATRIGTGVLSVLIFWFIFVFLFVFVFCLRLSFGFIYAYMYNVHLYDIGWDQCNLGSVSGTVVTNYFVCVSFYPPICLFCQTREYRHIFVYILFGTSAVLYDIRGSQVILKCVFVVLYIFMFTHMAWDHQW